MTRQFYLIGSLRNLALPQIAQTLRAEAGVVIFDDWYAAGPTADDSWRDYERDVRGRTYVEALHGHAADHVFLFDLHHLDESAGAILVLPAGKSSHLELGWMLGKGRKGYVLIDSPERWDVMYRFATGVFDSVQALAVALKEEK